MLKYDSDILSFQPLLVYLRSNTNDYFSGELSGGGYKSRKVIQAKVSERFNLGKDVKMREVWSERTCTQLLDCWFKEILNMYMILLSVYV